ncbi:ABC transporter permease [Natronospirillum operosum]|uniref:Transport permease protein n=1 Tax=Natronospirillum operosum TaxID=2759953 RepID=A0A4Z0WH58_9GAMM|nr:ABC transporter permease [Natronospirillum operosum]TGG95878.1 ABC transporter permease [Natronospirillum operosum]
MWQYRIAFQAIAGKEIRRFLRIWQQTLIPPVMTMVLYFVIFGNLIGRRIGEMGGFDYMAFIVPGLIMMSVITSAYGNVSSSFFGNKFQRSIEEILVAPVPNYVILAGFVAGGVTRGIMVGLLVTVVSLGFTSFAIHNPVIVLSVILLTAILFSVGGFINAMYATKFDDVALVPTFILTPLTYLGGVFYSIELLPPFWQWVSQLNPILHMVNAFRFGVLGVSDVNVWAAFGMIAVFLTVLVSWAMWLLKRGKGLRS